MAETRPSALRIRNFAICLGASFIHDFIFIVLLSCLLFFVSGFLTALSAREFGFPASVIMLHLGAWTPFAMAAALSFLGLLLQLFFRMRVDAKDIKVAVAAHAAYARYPVHLNYAASGFETARQSFMMTSSGLITVSFNLDIIYFYETGEPIWLFILTCLLYLCTFFLLIECHCKPYVRREVEGFFIGHCSRLMGRWPMSLNGS